MLVGTAYRIDMRGSLFAQVTSTTLYFRTEPIDPGPFHVTTRECLNDFQLFYQPALLAAISQTWHQVSLNLYQYHLRSQPYEQEHIVPPMTDGGFPEACLPPQIAAKILFVGLNDTETLRNRRFLHLPACPRFVITGGVITDPVFLTALSTVYLRLSVENNTIGGALKRYRVVPIIPLRRQPPNQPLNTPVATRIIQGLSRVLVRPGRIIRRTIGRGV